MEKCLTISWYKSNMCAYPITYWFTTQQPLVLLIYVPDVVMLQISFPLKRHHWEATGNEQCNSVGQPPVCSSVWLLLHSLQPLQMPGLSEILSLERFHPGEKIPSFPLKKLKSLPELYFRACKFIHSVYLKDLEGKTFNQFYCRWQSKDFFN